MLYLRCVYLSCSDLPRALHSFPTRRSSDLAISGTLATANSSETIRSWVNPPPRWTTTQASRKWSGAPLHLDRKSTRLNSSHPSISYAVFCLKKKMQDEIDKLTRMLGGLRTP